MVDFSKWFGGGKKAFRANSNCKEMYMCGEVEGIPCVKAMTLHRETAYSVTEPEYGEKNLHSAIGRLRPARDQHGVGCERPFLLEEQRRVARNVLRRNRRRGKRSGDSSD